MKDRPSGHLAEDKIDHNGETFDYIKELHEYLWGFVNAILGNCGGHLADFVDRALREAKILGFEQHIRNSELSISKAKSEIERLKNE